MRFTVPISIIFYCIICITFNASAQDDLTSHYKKETVMTLSHLMNDHYIHADVAKKTEEHLIKQLKGGHFDSISTIEGFAKALTESVQSINHDKHMRIRKNRPRKAAPNTPEALIEDRIYQREHMRKSTGGFFGARKMEGNVGYLDLRGFYNVDVGGPLADHYMHLLSTSDAMIIDLRKNGGGDPAMVQYLCSYFFDQKLHLNSLYYREGNRTEEFWTLDEVNGKKMPRVPLYVLTSDYTFSGAEEFSYNMQTQKRAVIVGQTTGGGANPGGTMPINHDLTVFMPTGMAINPVTKTSWEGIGVIPDVKAKAEDALDTAHDLAKIAAKKFRNDTAQKYKIELRNLFQALNNYSTTKSEDKVVESIAKCNDIGVLDEWSINNMGYDYLMRKQKPETAQVIFKTNTILYPDSPNVYDSYGEALAASEHYTQSLFQYQKAIDIATKNGDQDVKFYKENMEKVKIKMSGKKP